LGEVGSWALGYPTPMRPLLLVLGGAVLVASALAACGSSSGGAGAHDGPVDDAGPAEGSVAVDASPEAGASYPAFVPPTPTVLNGGGPTIKAARIVPVFVAGDSLQPKATDFLSKYLASPEWSAFAAEYGVAGATAAAPVVLPSFPAGLEAPQFEGWLRAQLDGTHSSWGPTDDVTLASTVYVFFIPPYALLVPGSVAVSDCSNGIYGWHAYAAVPGAPDGGAPDAAAPGVPVVYAVVGECAPDPSSTNIPTLDLITSGATHEIAEAVTDPMWDYAPAYGSVDALDVYWGFTGGPELGDMCEWSTSDFFTPPALGYQIQRLWSNAAATAGHDPCRPAPPAASAYFNSVPDAPDTFPDANLGTPVHGVILKVKTSRTIDVRLFSDAPSADWTVSVEEGTTPALLKYALDRSTGHNGDVLHLTIGPAPSAGGQATLFYVKSTSSGPSPVTNYWVEEVVVSP
jgi:hypothetical protein